MMKLFTLCSGIGSPEVAAESLGWQSVYSSEIEPFPSAVLAARHPKTINLGDMTKIHGGELERVNVICAGTPCQSFSVAGLRKGMDDPRGNLALVLLGIVDKVRTEWLVWENVPGVLSSNDGRDFGSFVGALGQLGYGWAYRIIDAQYCRVDGHERAVPQRRRRVFVVGCLGGWQRAAAVLFDRESLSGNPSPRRESRQGIARDVAGSIRSSGAGTMRAGDTRGQDNVVAATLNASFGSKLGLDNQHIDSGGGISSISKCLAGKMNRLDSETETLIPIGGFFSDPIAFSCKDHAADAGDISPTLRSMNHASSHANAGGQVAVAYFDEAQITSKTNRTKVCGHGVRRLTPTECERLMGFPDGYTAITYRNKSACDGPRYKALGNSMAVNCMKWIFTRIQMVSDVT